MIGRKVVAGLVAAGAMVALLILVVGSDETKTSGGAQTEAGSVDVAEPSDSRREASAACLRRPADRQAACLESASRSRAGAYATPARRATLATCIERNDGDECNLAAGGAGSLQQLPE